MDSRSDEQLRQEFVNKLALASILDAHANKQMHMHAATAASTFLNCFSNDNKHLEGEYKIRAVGNNNTVLLLQQGKYDLAVTISELPLPAIHAAELLKDKPWLGKADRVERTNPDAPYYKKFNETQNKTYPTDINHDNAWKCASVAINENYSRGSLASLASNEKLSVDDRINMCCRIGLAMINMIEDVQEQKCIWADLKPGNVLLKSDYSIGVPDIKAFFPYQETLVDIPADTYVTSNTRNDEEFNLQKENIKDNMLMLKLPAANNPIESIDYCIRNIEGKIVEGSIKRDELESRLKAGEKFDEAEFNNKMNAGRYMTKWNKAVYDIIAEQQQQLTRTIAYRPRFLDVTKGLVSDAFYDNQDAMRYASPELAREGANDAWNKEYPWQFANSLYFMATGEEKIPGKEFDFNKEIFNNPEKYPDGTRIMELIKNLSNENPDKRMILNDAKIVLGEIKNNRLHLDISEPVTEEKSAAVGEKPAQRRPSLSRKLSQQLEKRLSVKPSGPTLKETPEKPVENTEPSPPVEKEKRTEKSMSAFGKRRSSPTLGNKVEKRVEIVEPEPKSEPSIEPVKTASSKSLSSSIKKFVGIKEEKNEKDVRRRESDSYAKFEPTKTKSVNFSSTPKNIEPDEQNKFRPK
jgi:hypothetical protein